ncbi:TPA: helix-turn-helix domain-containing protein [Streptococcus suis]
MSDKNKKFKGPYLNIKAIIAKKGLKHKDIALKLGMDKSTFSLKINRSQNRDFTLSESQRLAHILGVSLSDF